MPLKQSIYFKLFMGNKEIDRLGAGCKNESFKFVGIHLDENLTWNHHGKAFKNKVSSAVFALSKVRNRQAFFKKVNLKMLSDAPTSRSAINPLNILAKTEYRTLQIFVHA